MLSLRTTELMRLALEKYLCPDLKALLILRMTQPSDGNGTAPLDERAHFLIVEAGLSVRQ